MKNIFKWLLLVPIDLFMTLFSVLVSPLMACFLKSDNMLPTWLWLWQTPDCDAIGSGEGGMLWTRKYSRWFQCMVWLCRNSCYGFAWYVLGAKVPENKVVRLYGNLETNNKPYASGWRIFVAENCWEFFWVFPTFPGRCFRARLGWKLDRWFAGNYSLSAQFVCSVNPWKTRN